ncbi:carbohydrate ABC transporter permease [Marinitenerispora sediminis]|uniref:carbohydrate ABC transporter permease n=1 Tax=Marinitenerispora sediminis TaxID=1931232 RepID=UPI00216221C9|nr:sugar ABC transporter permease [Marinitenerispora sediminis]
MFLLPLAGYVAVFFGYPVYHNVSMSLREFTVRSYFTGEAPFVGLANYAAVLGDPVFPAAARTTLLFTAGSITAQFLLGLGLALFFRRAFPLGGVLRALLLLPWLLPLVVSGAVWKWILTQDHGVLNQVLLAAGVLDGPIPWLTSTQWALVSVTLVNIWVGIPFNMVILYGGLQAIPESLYEAAALDGAGAWQAFRAVTWPLLRPVVAVVLMLGLVYTVKVFDVIMVLTGGGPAGASETLTTWSYALSFEEFAFGRGAAVGNLLIVVALLIALAYLRSVRRQMAEAAS